MPIAAEPPGPMVVECPACGKPVNAKPLGHTYARGDGAARRRWTLYACEDFGHPLVYMDSQAWKESFNPDEMVRVYPPQDRALSEQIPRGLREAHDEARKCFRSTAYAATVVMSLRVVEGACKIQGVSGKTLQDQLGQMRERKLIDSLLWDWADTLRGVRNSAAHFDEQATFSRDDAADSLAYSEALLDYLYVLKERFEALKLRRALPSPHPDGPARRAPNGRQAKK